MSFYLSSSSTTSVTKIPISIAKEPPIPNPVAPATPEAT